MLAMATWLFGTGATKVSVHLDGMHTKNFDIRGWLKGAGFKKIADKGKNPHGGTYERNTQILVVDFKSGVGDVVAEIDGKRILIEAKGGCINTRHPGQLSILRKRLYEAVGMLLDDRIRANRLIAAVPHHFETERIARRIAKRCRGSGIEVALVYGDGNIQFAE